MTGGPRPPSNHPATMSNYVLTPAAVRKLRGVLSHPSGNTGATLRPASISLDEFPLPFAVRYSASETSGGAWMIWLPDRAKLVSYDGSYISTISGVTASQKLPGGWYVINNAMQSSAEDIYLVVTIPASGGSGAPTATIDTSPGTPSGGATVHNILLAKTDSTGNGKQVKQFASSAVLLGGGGETVTPDDVSTEFIPDPPQGQSPTGDEGKLQVKGWNKGTPAASYNLAQKLHNGASADTIPARANSDGSLEYMGIGTLAQLLGSTVNKSGQKILTGLSWDTTNHRLVISSANVTIANGVITAWTDNAAENIETTAISSIIN